MRFWMITKEAEGRMIGKLDGSLSHSFSFLPIKILILFLISSDIKEGVKLLYLSIVGVTG